MSIVVIATNNHRKQIPMEKLKLLDSYAYLISHVTFSIKSRVNKEIRAAGYSVTAEHLGFLTFIMEQEGLSQSEIADRSTKDKTNVTRILDVMERNGLVERRKDSTDRRVFKIFTTREGRQLQKKLVPIAENLVNKIREGISDRELERMIEVLRKINENLDTYESE